MMKNIIKLLIISCIALIISGCASGANMAEVRAEMRAGINKLSVGMTKKEVSNIMGTKTYTSKWNGETEHVVNTPFRSEVYKNNDKYIEVQLYYTDKKKADGALTDDEMTPVVFINGIVDGWGWMYWNSLVKKYELRVR